MYAAPTKKKKKKKRTVLFLFLFLPLRDGYGRTVRCLTDVSV